MKAPAQVDRAASVEEAIAKLRTEKYDLIVSDYQTPAKDGLKLSKERALVRKTNLFVTLRYIVRESWDVGMEFEN